MIEKKVVALILLVIGILSVFNFRSNGDYILEQRKKINSYLPKFLRSPDKAFEESAPLFSRISSLVVGALFILIALYNLLNW